MNKKQVGKEMVHYFLMALILTTCLLFSIPFGLQEVSGFPLYYKLPLFFVMFMSVLFNFALWKVSWDAHSKYTKMKD